MVIHHGCKDITKASFSSGKVNHCFCLCIEMGQWRRGSAMQNILLVYWRWSWETCPEALFCYVEPAFVPLVSQNNDGTHVTHPDYKVPWSPTTEYCKITVMYLFLYYNFWRFLLPRTTQLLGVRRKFNLGIACMVKAANGGGTHSLVTATAEG